MTIYVNLKFGEAEPLEPQLDFILERGLAPELRLSAAVLDAFTPERHRAIAERIAWAGVRPSVHLPHEDVLPGARDELVRRAAVKRLVRAMEVARIYDAALMVGHANLLLDFYGGTHAAWLSQSVKTWSEVLKTWPEAPPLYIENVHETSPEPLAGLMRELSGRDVGICFDVGHWHFFASGSVRLDLARWLDALGPWIGHVHLHDNRGMADDHRGPGAGGIDFGAFFRAMDERGIHAGATFEPHGQDALLTCLAFIENHPDRFPVEPEVVKALAS